uniref:transposase n=1 Tax=Burkholderia ambifaria TaxID=152480 RepID=UPI001ABB3F02
RKRGRRPLPADLPRERIEYDLPEDRKICPCCGKALVSDSARPFPRSRASGMMVMAWWSPCRSRAIVSMIG